MVGGGIDFEEIYIYSDGTNTSGPGTQPTTCTYGLREDDGIFVVEINCHGYTTTKSMFTMASAKGLYGITKKVSHNIPIR